MLLSAAQGESDKKLMKHTLCSTLSLSRRQASKLYSISKMRKKAVEINETAVSMKDIRDKHHYLAKLEQRQFLLSCGENINEFTLSSSESSDGTDSQESDSDSSSTAEKEFFYERLVDTNVFDQHHSVDPLIIEFVSQSPKFGFSEEELALIEPSRLAYLKTIQEKEQTVEGISLSSTDSSGDETESSADETDSDTDDWEKRRATNKAKQLSPTVATCTSFVLMALMPVRI
ncbi:Hypothetical predicted protein [Paramuricea clavata]|uniref:Uncharacterized protein n=1 Tax=Paramuricea clavata TaxID=317549 RepID=A0A6S7G1F0_PARCT|nr:Hypothetical predicted protein [Paramuricea clavata]